MSQQCWEGPSAACSCLVNLPHLLRVQRKGWRGTFWARRGGEAGTSEDGSDGPNGVHNILVRRMRKCAAWVVNVQMLQPLVGGSGS